MIATLEEQLAASIAAVNARKAEAPTSKDSLPVGPAPSKSADLFVMPPPTPPASEIPILLSPSSVNTFLDCENKWYYRKVLNLPEKRGSQLGLGTAVHAALVDNFRQKIETRQDLPLDMVRASFVNSFTDELDEIVLTKDESADDLKECGETMLRVYMDRAAPSVQPAAVEEEVQGLIGDVPVRGFLDVRDVDGRIIDFKTAARKPSGTMQDYRFQITTYTMLHPAASGSAQLSTMTKTKTVDLHQDSFEITPADRKLTTRLYSIAREQMQAGVYAPNRKSFLCSRRYCSHWARCEDEFGGKVAE